MGDLCAHHAALADGGEPVGRVASDIDEAPLEDAAVAPPGEVSYERVRAILADAVAAERSYVVPCPHCRSKHTVSIPDWASRLRAVELWLRHERQTQRGSSLSALDGRPLDELTDAELEALIAEEEAA